MCVFLLLIIFHLLFSFTYTRFHVYFFSHLRSFRLIFIAKIPRALFFFSVFLVNMNTTTSGQKRDNAFQKEADKLVANIKSGNINENNLKTVIDGITQHEEERKRFYSFVLQFASYYGWDAIVSVCLDNDADVHFTNGWHTPVSIASERGHLKLVQYLVEHGADVNQQSGYDDATPLDKASYFGFFEIVRYLVEHGADINARNKDGKTPLMHACERYRSDIVKYLVQHGANVNSKDKYGSSVLHMVAQIGPLETVQLLVDHGADVNIQNNNGDSPLYFATLKHDLNIMDYLLANGADINVKTTGGMTPLHLASLLGDLADVQYLVKKGALINAKTSSGKTPLQLAVQNKKNEVVDFLRLYNRLNVGNATTNTDTEFIDRDVMPMNATERSGKKFFYNVDNVNVVTKKVRKVFQKELLNTLEDMNKDAKHPFTRKDWSITNDKKIKTTLKRLPNTDTQNTNNQSQRKPQAEQQDGGKTTKEYKSYKGKTYLVRCGAKGGKYILVQGVKKYLKK